MRGEKRSARRWPKCTRTQIQYTHAEIHNNNTPNDG